MPNTAAKAFYEKVSANCTNKHCYRNGARFLLWGGVLFT